MFRKRLLVIFSAAIISPLFGQFSGNALDFDGSSDMVVVNSVPALFSSPATNDFTFEAWVKPRTAIFSRIFFAQPTTTNFVSVSTGNTANIYFYVIVNGTTYSLATTANLPLNQWTHVAARWTASTSTPQVFFNGVLQAGAAGGGSSTGTNGLMTLGARPGGTQYFNGALDEARLWSEARSECEIQSNMNVSITGPQTNLVFDYDFNQGVGGGNNTGIVTLPDNAGTYPGTLNGFGLTAATSNWIVSTAAVTVSGNPYNGIPVSESATVCRGGSYTFPDGTTEANITLAMSHMSIIPGPSCDTLITTTVNVNATYSVYDTVAVCSGGTYTFPDAFVLSNITSPAFHTSTFQTIAGCDSLINTLVNVSQPSAFAETVELCGGGSYTFPDGSGQVISVQTVYVSTLINAAGCDSLVTTTVNVPPIYAMVDSASICSGDSFTFPDGATITNITSTLIYTSALSSINGCDSVITTTVDIIGVDTMVAMSNETLTANASGAMYQWLDCGNGYAPMVGDSGQSFTATVNGSYALAITQNGCTDTSGCFVILSTGIEANGMSVVVVYPNPANDQLFVNTGNVSSGTMELIDVTGAVVRRVQFTGNVFAVDLSDLASGIYFVGINTAEGRTVQKIVKE